MMILNEEEPRKSFKNSFYESLSPVINSSKNIWIIDKFDLFVFSVHFSVFLLFWLITLISGEFFIPLEYWDGPNYVYVAKTLYNIPSNNPWSQHFHYPKYYFACHLPGFPLVIRFFAFITFNSYWFGDILAIIFCSSLSIYSFRRLLTVFDCVEDPKWTTILYLCIPIRNVLYHCVGASEPLFLSYCYLSFIFYKINKRFLMLLALCGACMTRIEGLAIVGTIGLCYLLRFDILGGLITSLSLSIYAALLYIHQKMFGTYKAYFKFNYGLIRLQPFYAFHDYSKKLELIPHLNSILMLDFVMLGGTLILYTISIPMAIFATVYLIYSSMLVHDDVYRYILPGYILALLIGYDSIWSNPVFKKYSYFPLIFYAIIMSEYSLCHLISNCSTYEFLLEVMRS